MAIVLAALAITGGVLCFLLSMVSDVRARQVFARHVFSQDRHDEAKQILLAFTSALEIEIDDDDSEPELSELRDSAESLDPVQMREVAMLEELNAFADRAPESLAHIVKMSIHEEKVADAYQRLSAEAEDDA